MATMLATQRPVLTPLSPKKKKRTVLGNVTNIVRGLESQAQHMKFDGKGLGFTKPTLAIKKTLLSSNTKRPFSTSQVYDENSIGAEPKRMKSQTSSYSCEAVNVPKFELVTKPTAVPHSRKSLTAISSALASSAKSLKRRDIMPSSSSSPIGGQRASAGHSSLARKDSLASLSASSSPAKGIKRKITKAVRRIDPPSSVSSKSGSPSSIDGVVLESVSGRQLATPIAKSGTATSGTWRPGQPFPKNWMFDIHEDTLEETLTNLMYHSAGVLDISDEEDQRKKAMSEVERVGKENIPPPPSEAELAMPPPPVPHRVREDAIESDMEAERTRAPLGDVDVEVFYPKLKEEREAKKKAETKKAKGLIDSQFANIDNIVSDYMKNKEADLALPALPEETEEEAIELSTESKAQVASISTDHIASTIPAIVENTDFDDTLGSQTRSMAEDELFDDDL